MLKTKLSRVARWFALAAGCAAAFSGALSTAAASAATSTCTPLKIVYVAGTTEALNPYGGILGNKLVADMVADVPGTSAYTVPYPRGLIQPVSEQTGNRDLVSYLEAQKAACPSEKFVISGYSQGANVIADSFGVNTVKAYVGATSVAQLPTSFAPSVVAVLAFGPPYYQVGLSIPAPYSSVLAQYCTTGDIFCSPTPENSLAGLQIHLQSYQAHLAEAAAYAALNFATGKVA